MSSEQSTSGKTVPLTAVSYVAGATLAGKYRIEREIGAGAMGSVWLATHLNLGQRVAIKLISKDYADSREARARFNNEAKAVAQLRSRFVVQVFDNGETDQGTPFIVMEYLEGESLEERVHRTGPIGLQETVRIVSQVARALERAHAMSIVHRDLKPANVFLAKSLDDDDVVAKVLDFGVAKFTDDTTSTTRTGSVIGTPQFMSPEQVRGLKTVDHRTDLYALGMITYTMLTGRVAFAGEAFGDLLLAICTQPLPSIHQENPSLPPSLDGWFQRACARDADQRFQAPADLIEMLVVASGLGRGVVDVPELVPAASSFARGGSTGDSAGGAGEQPAPGGAFGGAPGLETVGTATMPAGVPRPAGAGKILAAVAILMLAGGVGLGLLVYLFYDGKGGVDDAPAAAPTEVPAGVASSTSRGPDAGPVDASDKEEEPSSVTVAEAKRDEAPPASTEAVPAAKKPTARGAAARAREQILEARRKAKVAAEPARRAAEKAKKTAQPSPAKPPAEPDVGF